MATSTAASAAAAAAVSLKQKQQPLIILAGWLGCEGRQLRRYEELYRNANCRVVSRIATPTMVFRCCLSLDPLMIPQSALLVQQTAPSSQLIEQQSQQPQILGTMQDLAWDVMNVINESEPGPVFFHAFSNGGCFLWEQVRRIFALCEENNYKTDHFATPKITTTMTNSETEGTSSTPVESCIITDAQRERLKILKSRLSGVVFDSCPGNELHQVDQALKFCSLRDRLQVMIHHPISYTFLHVNMIENRVRERAVQYHNGLKDDRWKIPQLYLFSKDDPLIPYQVIEDLIQYRRKEIGNTVIMKRPWDTSLHCAHLKFHPEEYEETVRAFISGSLEKQSSL